MKGGVDACTFCGYALLILVIIVVVVLLKSS